MSTRGADDHQDKMFSNLSPAARVPKDHPLRLVKKMVNQALREMWHDFEAIYAKKVWHHSVFSKNRDRFLPSYLAASFFARLLKQAAAAGLLSDEHFTVDGTLIEAWASLKSFPPKDDPRPSGGAGRNPEVDFHGERRVNEIHASTTDPEARLYLQGKRQRGQTLLYGARLDAVRQRRRKRVEEIFG